MYYIYYLTIEPNKQQYPNVSV